MKTSIEWTDFSINPIRARLRDAAHAGATKGGYGSGIGHYCEKISSGCANCYSSTSQARFGMPQFPGVQKGEPAVDLLFDDARLQEVLRRRVPTKWFWCDQTDLFGRWVPDEWIARCFDVMARTPWHTHQVLTKRTERMADYRSRFLALPNVWLGTSVENQKAADERIPHLLCCPAAVRFLSCEPLLGPIDLRQINLGIGESIDEADGPPQTFSFDGINGTAPDGSRIDWIIVGGESGSGARPMHPDWARSIRNQCTAAGVAFHFKQWGEWAPFYDNVDRYYSHGHPTFGDSNREYNAALRRMIKHHGGSRLVDDRREGWQPFMVEQGMGVNGGSIDQMFLLNVGKKSAGRLLDGREWNEFPNGLMVSANNGT